METPQVSGFNAPGTGILSTSRASFGDNPFLSLLIAEMKTRKMAVILVEPFQSRRIAEKVAGHAGATVVDVCQFPGGLPDTDDYFSLMDVVVNGISSALE